MNATVDKSLEHAWSQAQAQLESIEEMVKALQDADDDEDARQTIEEDALSVEVRSAWTTVGEQMQADEYCILLCTGGPAVRIVGGLGNFNEPDSARIECQDWGTPWTDFPLTSDQEQTVLAYARCFYFGE